MADVSELEAKLRAAHSAATDAAATVVKCIDRIMLMEPVVLAARKHALAVQHAAHGVPGAVDTAARTADELVQMVDAYNALADKAAS